MRWDNLFDDLEGQLEYGLTAEEIDLKAEQERLRLGQLCLRERLIASYGTDVPRTSRAALTMVLTDGSRIAVRPTTFGKDWFAADLIEQSQRNSQCVVSVPAIAEILLSKNQIEEGLRHPLAPGSGPGLSGRLALGFVLRDLCRRRQALEIRTLRGVLHGTIDRVGRDHFDLAVHEPGTLRRDREVSHYRVVPLSQFVLLRV